MCGINGVFDYDLRRKRPNRQELLAARGAMLGRQKPRARKRTSDAAIPVFASLPGDGRNW